MDGTVVKKRKRAKDVDDCYTKLLRRNKAVMRRNAAIGNDTGDATPTTQGRPVIIALDEMIRTKSPFLVFTSAVADAETDYEGVFDRRYTTDNNKDLVTLLPEARAKLWSYQEEAVRFIADREIDTAAVGCRGVMLCDDMGLGKTLESLTYIYRDIQRRQLETGRRFNGVTLIVVPAAVIGTWIAEIENSFPPNSLRYIKMTGDRVDVPDRQRLETCTDIVFTTYTIVSLVYKSIYATTHGGDEMGDEVLANDQIVYVQHRYGLLFDQTFVRIVLDEAHYIANPKTIRFRAMSTLRANIRWMNTGTPIQNSYANIYACFDFIGVRLDTLPVLKNGDTPISSDDEAHIKGILEKVMIRRLRHQVELPLGATFFRTEVDRQVVYVNFDTRAERILYLMYAEYGLSKMQRVDKNRHRSLVGHVHGENDINITLAIQLMRQCCIDFHIMRRLILPNGMLMGTNQSALNTKRTSFGERLFLDEARDYVHLERDNGVLEYSAFTLGGGGGVTTFRYKSGEEPWCKYKWRPYDIENDGDTFVRELYRAIYVMICAGETLGSIIETMVALVGDDAICTQVEDIYRQLQLRILPRYGTKQLCVLRYIAAIEDESDKIVVFSDSVSFLRRMAECLADHGIRSCSITGENTRNSDIESQLALLRTDASVRVLLLSLKMAVGLNIPWANHMLFCSMWWNPYIESQAECRCQRMGQTKQVHIRYFLIRNSIEEHIHNLAAYKKNIAYTLIESHAETPDDDEGCDAPHLDEATRKRLFDFQLTVSRER